MRVLIVSHNVIGGSTNLGITLANTFGAFGPEQVAQLYVRSEIPCRKDICGRYYRITDKEAMAGVFTRRVAGTEYEPAQHLLTEGEPTAAKEDAVERIRMLRRKPLMDMGRDLYWALSPWMGDKLKAWLKRADPDVVFYAAGDYAFSFAMAWRIAKMLDKPLVIAFYDDYFEYIKYGDTLPGRLRHAYYMRIVNRTVRDAAQIVAICDRMAEDYSRRFQKKCTVLYTPVEQGNVLPEESGKNVVYFGTLGLGRDDQLVSIGRAVAATATQTGIDHIDVYTNERKQEALEKMTWENGIVLHPAVAREEVKRLLCHSMVVIHTESFDPDIRKRVRYSISTKIPEALAYGPCLLAYGPAEAASISYLEQNRAAWVITRQEELQRGILELLTNPNMRQHTVCRARQLARENHNAAINTERLKRCFEAAIHDFQQRNQRLGDEHEDIAGQLCL